MTFLADHDFFIDPRRCIGCQACVQACSECDTHRGTAMIHLEYVDRTVSPQTVPVICMHCDEPTCAQVCPADAIKKNSDGIVMTAKKERCVGCNHCGLACPFGVPKVAVAGLELMMKCDMCYDRTSVGKTPMCASVCPSGALFFGTRAQIAELRPRSRPVQEFQFGEQMVRTKVQMMVARDHREDHLDVGSGIGGTVNDDLLWQGLYDPDEPLEAELA